MEVPLKRRLLALVLFVAVSAPSLVFMTPPTGAQIPKGLQPTVRSAISHGVSLAASELPTASRNPQASGAAQNRPALPLPHGQPADVADPLVQHVAGPLAMPGPQIQFAGINATASGCGCLPPDTNGAAGPDQYVQMVNSAFAVYAKTGQLLSGPTLINALWSNQTGACHDNNNGDPVVVYDQLSDRWLLSQFAVPGGATGYHECIAISKTGDATGQYYVYDFLLSTTKFEDYPHFGHWPDAYYMTTNQFDITTTVGAVFEGAGAFAFERAKMLAGLPAQMVQFDTCPTNTGCFDSGMLPSDLDGRTPPPAGSPNYVVEVNDPSNNNPSGGYVMNIFQFHVDWTNPLSSTFGIAGLPNSALPVAAFARPQCTDGKGTCVPQKNTGQQVDAIGDRIMFRLAYRNFGEHESVVMNHTVVVTPTYGTRWYELRNPGSSPAIYQSGTYAPDLLYRWMGSIAMDQKGDIAVGFSTSSATAFPSIAYAGRYVTDTLGMLSQGDNTLYAGTGSQTFPLGRWGDYSDLTIDPADDCTFWYTNEYYAVTDPTGLGALWQTRIGSFKFPSCTNNLYLPVIRR